MAIKKELLEELRQRRREALAGGGAEKIKKRHAAWRLSARERVELFFDRASFNEHGMHVNHACHMPGFAGKYMPGDAVVTGTGNVDGRPVAIFSQDFTVGGGALGQMHAKKICDIMTIARETGIPVLAINDSGGADGPASIFLTNKLAPHRNLDQLKAFDAHYVKLRKEAKTTGEHSTRRAGCIRKPPRGRRSGSADECSGVRPSR